MAHDASRASLPQPVERSRLAETDRLGYVGEVNRPGSSSATARTEALASAPPPSAVPPLTIENLTRRWGGRAVVHDFDLSLTHGERLALCGPNGSGKTTILRCVAGTVTPTSGSISVHGYLAGSREARRLMGVSLSQERSFYLRLSGQDNLVFAAGIRGIDRTEALRRIAQLDDELELGSILSKRVDRCSTGMVQQLAFARALIGRPRLLLLDESTKSLDRAAIERFWRTIESRPEVALVIATHNEDDVARCHRRLDLATS
jgi:ABC-type multidrug transport system ATPase subunit